MSQEKGSGRKRAVEVVLVRTNRERREEDQLKKVGTSVVTGMPTVLESKRKLFANLDAYAQFGAPLLKRHGLRYDLLLPCAWCVSTARQDMEKWLLK